MIKIILQLFLLFSCICFAGCTTYMRSVNMSGTATRPEILPPAPPAGMQIGAPYISALNESCYVLISAQGSFAPTEALCLRKQEWIRMPAVVTVMPSPSINPVP